MTLAVLGTGIMGGAMARNWLRAGERVRVWNRSPAKARALAADGAYVAGDPADAVNGAEVIVTMLYDADSVAGVLAAAAPKLSPGALWIQASTVGVTGAARLADLADGLGLSYVDAPVVGTRQPAEQGTLGVLASGPEAVRAEVERVLGPVSARVHWLGAAGAGSRMKLVFNTWALAAVAGVAQAIALAEGLGEDPAAFLELIRGGPLDLGYAHVKGATMISRDFTVAFPVSGAAKDAALILDAAAEAGLDLAVIGQVRRHLDEAARRGHRDDDLAALYVAVRDPS
jgi:3-hydroxyisobutyrate dehydrogenase